MRNIFYFVIFVNCIYEIIIDGINWATVQTYIVLELKDLPQIQKEKNENSSYLSHYME